MLLTTHYLDEAEALCDRVAIIARGKIVATGSPRELVAAVDGAPHGRSPSTVQPLPPAVFDGLAGVARAAADGDAARFRASSGPNRCRPARPARGRRDQITELRVRKATLEIVFLELDWREREHRGAGHPGH